MTSMTQLPRKILVTCPLYYANGAIHLGHIVDSIQGDIWVRFQRMRGHECIFVCGDDAHGTPIMLAAKKAGLSPEELIAQAKKDHQQDFADFNISFDNYYTTHSEENRQLSESIYQHLYENGDITTRTILQAYDEKENMFLPDRYVKGECPRCGAKDQYGDNCEVCSASYEPLDLKNPISVVSGSTPVAKESEHYFFQLQKYAAFLKPWLKENRLQEEMQNKLDEWFEVGLHEKDISRDTPYFGFKIPNTSDKYFYVWFDAPIGYISITKNLCEKRKDINFEMLWKKESPYELYHFVGKDIIYFHALFWPAILKGANYRLPSAIFAHGFLTVDGKKMSKSRGTFIKARTYLNHLNPEYLRYYFAAKLNNRVEDIDLNFSDFILRINSDLVGKVVNIASRCASFIEKHFNGKLFAEAAETDLMNEFISAGDDIATYFDQREFSRAIRLIMELADKANQYIDAEKPWSLMKEKGQEKKVHMVCSVGLNLFRIVMTYLKPVLPHTAQETEVFLNIPEMTWETRKIILRDHKINSFKPLLQRITEDQITAMKNEELSTLTTAQPVPTTTPLTQNPLLPEISIDDFAKIDLRIAKIVKAESVPEADKLLKLTLDLGGETRQVFAGIKSAYEPSELEGKLTVMVANLAPRKMRFGVSEGMVLAASGCTPGLWILQPDEGAAPGMRVK
jgi:methionyl-tRNA synthetase